jgi:hypothetical protein
MARHFYAPLLISSVPDTENGTVELHVTSDLLTEIAGIVRWHVTTSSGDTVNSGKIDITVGANGNTPVTTLDFSAEIATHTNRDLLVWIELWVDDVLVSDNLALFARPKHLPLQQPTIEWELNGDMITLTSDRPALWVWLESADAKVKFADNFFHLRPGQSKQVHVEGLDSAENLTINSLYDTYQSS